MAKTKIIIADDHKIIRDGIASMVQDQPDIQIAGEAENGKQVLELCRSEEVDLVVMDINMENMGGIEATQKLKEEFPDIKVLTLTMMQEKKHIRKMIEAGAAGYIFKNSGREELITSIKALMEGKHYFSNEATYLVMEDMIESGSGKPSSAESDEITSREIEVLQLICEEYTNQQIADELYISVRTVDAHRRNLLQKTGAKNTAGLVRYAVKHNIL